MNAVVKMNVMLMPSAITLLVATHVTVRLDTVEMEGTVQVCEQTHTIMYASYFCLCTDINECEDPGGSVLCDENANCNDTDGSYDCVCRVGYSGDGFNCSGWFRYVNDNMEFKVACYNTDIDECADNSDKCDQVNADCSNTVGSYDCECHVGFTGDGRRCGTLFRIYIKE